MRQARAMLPYAVVALVVIAASALALSYAVLDVRDARVALEGREGSTASPSPRALPELSRAGRLAYWRADAGGGADLFVSNTDGSMRRRIAHTDGVRRVSLTRWLPAGDAVAYVESGALLVILRLDGTRTDVQLPTEARDEGGRIVDHRWSPDGKRVAASVVRADLRSDVYVARADDRQLARLTTLDDAFATDWVAADQVLVNTGGGVIGVLSVTRQNAIRPLTGSPAASPILGEDGRIHFLTGAIVPSPRDATLPFLTASGATAWSVALDGSELRQETQTSVDDVRLDATLGGTMGASRYLAHRGSSPLQIVLSASGVSLPPIDAGAVERLTVTGDGRGAIGFTATRMLRFEVRREVLGPTLAAPTVLLDQVSGGDAWAPREVTPPPVAPASVKEPRAQYAFALGGNLWSMTPDGEPSFLRAKSPSGVRRAPLAPAWSPRGDRMVTIELAGAGVTGVGPNTPIAVTIDRNGNATRYAEARAATGVPSWAPSGEAFAVIVDRRGIDAQSGSAELEARFLTVDGARARDPIPARDVAWTKVGIFVLTDRALDLVDGSSRRTVIDLAAILRDPRGDFPSDVQTTTLAALTAAPDGAFVSFRVAVSPRSGASRFAIVVVRTSDGRISHVLPGATVQDLAWSPTRPQLGLTSTASFPGTAQVLDVVAERLTWTMGGRFAGWSPDGSWAYVALYNGLEAWSVNGPGVPVRIGPIGVPVSATRP